MKKRIALLLAGVMSASIIGCGNQTTGQPEGTDNQTVTEQTDVAPAEDTSTSETQDAEIQEDAATGELIFGSNVPTDISASLTVFTNRTDLIDTVYQDYITRFNEVYPNVKIEYEAMTDYEGDMTIRLTTDNWGDICMIPKTVALADLKDYFVSFGTVADLENTYNFITEKASGGEGYGMPWACNASGVVYNKKVFQDAGVTEIPTTPEEFLAAMQQIKDNTDCANPYYTNYSAGWPLSAWEDYCYGTATGDPDYKNNKLPKADQPFSQGTPHYTVYKLMYDLANQGLIEEDPTTTDWEACKGMLGRGEIGAMALGSWSIVQMKEQAENPDDIGYMPFPITVDGKQYSTGAADYCFGINVNASEDNILASKAYINWLITESGYAKDQGAISVLKSDPMPEALKDFEEANVELVASNPATAENEGLYDKINDSSEVGLTGDTQKARIIEAAIGLTNESFDDIMNDWNEKWTKAQQENGLK